MLQLSAVHNQLEMSTFITPFCAACFSIQRFLFKSHSTSRSVKCVEINKQSKISFEKSASRLPTNLGCTITWHNTDASVVSNQSCICTAVIPYIQAFIGICNSVLWHQEPVHWLEGSSVVIVDPPRKGLHPSVINALQKVALSERKAYKAKRCSQQHYIIFILPCFYFE